MTWWQQSCLETQYPVTLQRWDSSVHPQYLRYRTTYTVMEHLQWNLCISIGWQRTSESSVVAMSQLLANNCRWALRQMETIELRKLSTVEWDTPMMNSNLGFHPRTALACGEHGDAIPKIRTSRIGRTTSGPPPPSPPLPISPSPKMLTQSPATTERPITPVMITNLGAQGG